MTVTACRTELVTVLEAGTGKRSQTRHLESLGGPGKRDPGCAEDGGLADSSAAALSPFREPALCLQSRCFRRSQISRTSLFLLLTTHFKQ